MNTVLQLEFLTHQGRSRRLTINDANTEVDDNTIQEAMKTILDSGAFPEYVKKNRARFVATEIKEVELDIEE